MGSEHRQLLKLPRGACRMWRADPGSELITVRGSLRVTERYDTLGEGGMAMTRTLAAGQVHHLGRCSWLTLVASVDCELVVVAPAVARRSSPWRLLGRIIQAGRLPGRATRVNS